jgi:MFS family permease
VRWRKLSCWNESVSLKSKPPLQFIAAGFFANNHDRASIKVGSVSQSPSLSKTVLTAHLGIALGLSPLPFYTLTVLAPILSDSLALPVAALMAGISIMTVVVIGAGPWVGKLTDRLGVKPVVLVSQTAFSLALMAFALNHGSVWQYWLHWLLLSIAGLGTMPVVWLKALNQFSTPRKAQVFAWALSGTGVCALTLPKLCQWLLATPEVTVGPINLHNWQLVYVVLGLIALLPLIPSCLVLQGKSVGHAEPVVRSDMVNPTTGMTLSEAVKQRQFWLIALAFLPISFAVGGPIPNLMFIFKQHHFELTLVGRVLPSLGIWVIVGRLTGGWLMDRLPAAKVALVMLSLPLLALLWLLFTPTPTDSIWPILLLVMGLGLAIGLEYDLLAYLTARYFGRKHFGLIYATLYSAFALGAGFAATIYAYMNTLSNSYDPILLMGASGMLVGAMALLCLGNYRFND